uniref:Cyclopropane-fatty-acyl-phospholipid synthase n=1 Tax=Parascaris univalens TaxID=6257 RepID=A0A915BDP6_PARUN
MASDNDMKLSGYFSPYQILLRFLFIPLIRRYFSSRVSNSNESLRISITNTSEQMHFGNVDAVKYNSSSVPVTFYLHNPIRFCMRILLDAKIGLGESYMLADWDASPSAKDFLTLLIRARQFNSHKVSSNRRLGWPKLLCAFVQQIFVRTIRAIAWFFNYIEHRIHENSMLGSARNIRQHYDLGNEMFQMFLDSSMTYSCALFETLPEKITKSDFKMLEKAQMRKYDAMLDELQLKPSDHVLEIGCGWGACSIRAVQKFGCRWTGITISAEQFKIAQERVREYALEDKIDFKLLDYRLEKGVYDKLIAIEMIEAVGHEYLPEFFRIMRDRIAPGGIACIQAITCPNAYYERYRRSSDFIKKYIFPGGHLPSEDAISEALPPQLNIERVSHMGMHYAITLDLWFSAWMERQKDIIELGYSQQFHRKWQFYFALCSALFEYSHIDTVQMRITRA